MMSKFTWNCHPCWLHPFSPKKDCYAFICIIISFVAFNFIFFFVSFFHSKQKQTVSSSISSFSWKNFWAKSSQKLFIHNRVYLFISTPKKNSERKREKKLQTTATLLCSVCVCEQAWVFLCAFVQVLSSHCYCYSLLLWHHHHHRRRSWFFLCFSISNSLYISFLHAGGVPPFSSMPNQTMLLNYRKGRKNKKTKFIEYKQAFTPPTESLQMESVGNTSSKWAAIANCNSNRKLQQQSQPVLFSNSTEIWVLVALWLLLENYFSIFIDKTSFRTTKWERMEWKRDGKLSEGEREWRKANRSEFLCTSASGIERRWKL